MILPTRPVLFTLNLIASYSLKMSKISNFFQPASKRLKSTNDDSDKFIVIPDSPPSGSIRKFVAPTRSINLNDDIQNKPPQVQTKTFIVNNNSSNESVEKIIIDEASITVESVKTTEVKPLNITILTSLLHSVEDGWKNKLINETKKPYFKALETFLESEWKQKTIYPVQENIFASLNNCPFDQVKVVIIGQDPYHGPNQAHGLAFSVQRGVPPPPSLKNMFTELMNDSEIQMRPPKHGCLISWSQQGVLLLNTCMTVRQSEPNSHAKKGWEDFTDAIIKQLSMKTGLVYLLWGKPAQLKCKNIDHKNNCVITTSHPSPLGAYKSDEPFMGSKCFSRCNRYLLDNGQTPIDWNIV